MTLVAHCDCGGEVLFQFDGPVKSPTAECDECGNEYRLKAERVMQAGELTD